MSSHDSIAQVDYGPILPPLPDDISDDEEAMRIVCLVKNNQPLVRSPVQALLLVLRLRCPGDTRVLTLSLLGVLTVVT